MSTFRQCFQRGLQVRGMVFLQPLDLVIGGATLLFFLVSAVVNNGDVNDSLRGALLIMLIMFVVGAAIEIIIEALRDLRGLGTAVGFITNGPEALCLVVGLLAGDIIFAASTPLGSNFMNPLMLAGAALGTHTLTAVWHDNRRSTLVTLTVTAALAGLFFALPEARYALWVGVAVALSAVLFWRRPADRQVTAKGTAANLRRWHAAAAAVLLAAAGYCLDPVVSLTAAASRAPKGVIGFFVLAALTSWPEFRSCVTLLRRGRSTSAVLNITVSNLTNLWLAALGVVVHLALH
ncbi:MAG: sodium:proton exchanger [Candidatus Krumholzibacteria bacterium]|nr:sodium:proton exchanger [Candidatus Krumholzibacteria bacterium]